MIPADYLATFVGLVLMGGLVGSIIAMIFTKGTKKITSRLPLDEGFPDTFQRIRDEMDTLKDLIGETKKELYDKVVGELKKIDEQLMKMRDKR